MTPITYSFNSFYRPVLLLLCGIVMTFSLSGQNFESEEDMIKAAAEMFKNEQFEKSMPLYSQLVSLYPKNLDYNMKYGASLLHADRDKTMGLKYLKFASSKGESEAISHYYYGKALHRNYEFTKAIKHYQKFKSSASSKEVAKLNVDREIEMCNNGKALLVNVFDLNVLEKKEISQKEFFRICHSD